MMGFAPLNPSYELRDARRATMPHLRQLIRPTSGDWNSCPALLGKIFLFSGNEIRAYCLNISRRQEGRIAIVTNVVRDAVDAKVLTDEQHRRGRRSCVVLAPLGWCQVRDGVHSHGAGDGG
jgi:hypothetical protein